MLTAPGTWERLCAAMEGAEHRSLGLTTPAVAGPFRVRACRTSHDAAEPLALVVDAPDGASVGVAYDLGRPTSAVRYLLRGVTAVVLEANHDDVLLRTSGYPPSVQQRIAGAGGHLSNRAAAELLSEIHHDGLGVVVLAHLSQRCNGADEARATIEPALRRVPGRTARRAAGHATGAAAGRRAVPGSDGARVLAPKTQRSDNFQYCTSSRFGSGTASTPRFVSTPMSAGWTSPVSNRRLDESVTR